MHPPRIPNSGIRAKLPARGGRLRPARKGDRQRLARKGLPPAASPAASRGGDAGRRCGHPLVGRLQAAKGSRRLRWGNGGGAVRVKKG
ncbi:hypothetical protein BHE74_00045330 [Ensete ventricosum]|nr:hypothetical protein BHE74_00045330 [Ensete ventricosum]